MGRQTHRFFTQLKGDDKTLAFLSQKVYLLPMAVVYTTAFNRTLEELKRSKPGFFHNFGASFNRTLEELKHLLAGWCVVAPVSFNRALEELKQLKHRLAKITGQLLIEP